MSADYPPKKNAIFTFYVGLQSQAQANTLQANPTLAAGDVKVSTDGGALANLGTLPAVTPAGGKAVLVTMSAGEMNGDDVVVIFSDVAGAEWKDLLVHLKPVTRQLADLAYPATSGRSMVVDAAGLVDANMVKAGPTGSGTAQTARDLGASVLLSSGTGAGQLDFTAGVVKANLAQILGTALTETAGQIAAAFKKFFDKATPTGTVNSLPDAVPGAASGVAIVGSNMGSTTSLTGDAFARLGAPAGASVSADIAAVKTETAAIKAKTDNLPSGPRKNVALPQFTFLMVDSADHVTPKTGLTVSGTISKDGGAFVALTNAVAEIANGAYKVTGGLIQAEMNADAITLRFTATGADARIIVILTSA